MSKYSGKCDFADHINIHGMDSVRKSKIYLGYDNYIAGISLNIKSERDAMPFYAHIISFCSMRDGVGNVILTERSWLDLEEEDRLKLYRDAVLKEYRRCKRKKIEFVPEEVLKKVCQTDFAKEAWMAIINRVAEYGDAAGITGIHIPHYSRMKKMLGDDIKKYDEEHSND